MKKKKDKIIDNNLEEIVNKEKLELLKSSRLDLNNLNNNHL